MIDTYTQGNRRGVMRQVCDARDAATGTAHGMALGGWPLYRYEYNRLMNSQNKKVLL
ncbi:MAG: hypothetical protein ABFD82_03775 [Syntrophaceae bacterium]